MENLKLSIRIEEGRFQIWEEIGNSGFFCCEDILNNAIQHPQELAHLIHKAITDPEIRYHQLKEKGLTTIEGQPTVITISDDEVIFTRGNIIRIEIYGLGGELHVSTGDGSSYYFNDWDAIKFLNHFPYSYFEKAKNLAEIYKSNLPN